MSGEPASVTFPALGTTAELLVTDHGRLDGAAELLRAELAAMDQACSRFRSDSELSAVNRSAGRPVAAGPLLREAVRVALVAAAQTGGDVDPTLGRRLCDLGYDRTFSQLPADGPAVGASAGRARAWRLVKLDERDGTVQVPDGVELDLGATAKALAADHAARLLATVTGAGVLVNLGGDLAMAGPAPADGWRVRVADRPGAARPGDREQTVVLRSGGLATSSTTVRVWQRGGVRHHHVLDPRTGRPATPTWRTVSVTAGTCVDANTASTAAVVRGTAAVGWLRAAGLPARLVAAEGRVTTVGDWPRDPSEQPAGGGTGTPDARTAAAVLVTR